MANRRIRTEGPKRVRTETEDMHFMPILPASGTRVRFAVWANACTPTTEAPVGRGTLGERASIKTPVPPEETRRAFPCLVSLSFSGELLNSVSPSEQEIVSPQ